jgi:Uma2 family endonuclease
MWERMKIVSVTREMMAYTHDLGIRLEIVGGLPVWEAQPLLIHQEAVDRIRATIRKRVDADTGGCGCLHYYDLALRFPDGSQKRPDITIFCRRPDEVDEEVTLLPEAVIEILSKGYEAKDLQVGVPFYLAQGVKDVIVFDPYTLKVLHFVENETREMTSSVEIELQCGCVCSV